MKDKLVSGSIPFMKNTLHLARLLALSFILTSCGGDGFEYGESPKKPDKNRMQDSAWRLVSTGYLTTPPEPLLKDVIFTMSFDDEEKHTEGMFYCNYYMLGYGADDAPFPYGHEYSETLAGCGVLGVGPHYLRDLRVFILSVLSNTKSTEINGDTLVVIAEDSALLTFVRMDDEAGMAITPPQKTPLIQ